MGYTPHPDTPDTTTRYTYRGCFFSVIWIIVGIFVLTGFLSYQLDSSCRSTAFAALPDYPGATLVYEEHSLLRPWGIGETYRVLVSEDNANDIRRWYRTRPETPTLSGTTHGIDNALIFWLVRPMDGESRIVLGLACGQSFTPGWYAK